MEAKLGRPPKIKHHYGRAMVRSGLTGLRDGRDLQLQGRRLSEVLAQSARASLGLGLIGACAGLVALYASDRRRFARGTACGLAGAAIGFVGAFTWNTRELTSGMARSALKQMGTVRDERWIDRHPIDYA